MTEIEPILNRLGLAQYIEAFIQEGFDTWETVLDITESDLDALNVKLGHRRRLQREISIAWAQQSDQFTRQHLRATLSEEKRPYDGGDEHEARKSEEEPIVASHGKRKYRRHPKPDENAPIRPPSAYVIFSNKIREDLKPQSLSFTEIAKRVGESWQLLLLDEKERFEAQAAVDKERYNAEMVKYKKTSNYQAYAVYLTEFKIKNTDGKRARLESESEASIAGHTDLYTPTGSWSSYIQHASPPRIGPIHPPTSISMSANKAESSSPSSPSSTPPLHHNVIGADQGTERAIKTYSPAQKSVYRGKDIIQGPSLPRILLAENRESFKGNLPPLSIDPLLQTHGNPQTNSRRSNTAPSSFLRHDTSNSSKSSRSSNLSSNTTSSSALFSPITPIEDVRMQRALPLPSPMLSKVVVGQKYGDQSHALFQPSKLALPSKSSTSPALPQTEYIPPSSGDIPQERHSLMKLSIAPIATSPNHSLRSYSREQSEPWPTSDPGCQQVDHRSQPSPQGSQHQPTPVPSERQQAAIILEEKSTGQLFHGLQDPLSVLAYAGRLVDRESQKPP